MVTPDENPSQRADAVRNRSEILSAARAEFAEHGTAASMDAIAKRAGLAKGTLFRHFTSKEDLIAALFASVTLRLEEAARSAADESDPLEALTTFMLAGATVLAEDPLFCETIGRPAFQRQGGAAALSTLHALVDGLVTSARKTKQIRSEITADDVLLLMVGVQQATGPLGDQASSARRRYADLILSGMRSTGDVALRGPAPSII
ncbi:TetR/AcrR family transcriptional regulator [Leifsonia poae]|uniref:TetR/AcrR family transcriptional regulator n=1 Tax=Leifsonia poae TaxID=110933 RepID=UPI003D67937C